MLRKTQDTDEWLDRPAAASFIGLSAFWLQKHASDPDGPRFIIHGRKAWYKRTELEAWLRAARNVSRYGAGGKDTLEVMWAMSEGNKRTKPPVEELEASYKEQHGEVIEVRVAKRRRLRKKLWEVMSTKARALFEEYEAV